MRPTSYTGLLIRWYRIIGNKDAPRRQDIKEDMKRICVTRSIALRGMEWRKSQYHFLVSSDNTTKAREREIHTERLRDRERESERE